MKFIKTSEWLYKQMSDSSHSFIIFDCRYDLSDEDAGEIAYQEGHIPGAHYAHLSFDLSSSASPTGEGGRHPLPDPQLFAQYLSERGVTPTSTIVAYDSQGGAMASRLRWLLTWLGHEGEVYILDEGFKGWVEVGYAVETAIPSLKFEDVNYTINLQDDLVVDHHYVLQHINNEDVVIIDSRDVIRYRGEQEPIDKKAGHIPSAVNYVWSENKHNGKWMNEEQLKARFASLNTEKEIVVYCGSGVTATPNVFALQEAGFKNVKLYAGSWSEWSRIDGYPIATGKSSATLV